MIVIGAQMLSIAVNGILSEKEKRIDLNYVLKTLSYTIGPIVLIFGLVTYALSWNIGVFLERQALVISSTLMVFWVPTIVLNLKKHIQALAAFILISGASIATWGWYSLGDAVMYNLGFACIAGLTLYTMFVLLEFMKSWKTVAETKVSKPMELETTAQ
jgi:hypothetical protein